MSRGPDTAVLVARAVQTMAQRQGCPVSVIANSSTRWASATFTGARHLLSLTAQPGAALDDWLANLADDDFTLRGHLVADVAISAVTRQPDAVAIDLDVLTLEES